MASVKREELVVGNIGNVYDVRHVGSDKRAVVDFSIAVTPRVRNAKTNEWEDGQTSWVNCVAWGKLAENIKESFNKGDRVIVQGEVKDKPAYTKDDGTEIPSKPQLIVNFAGHEISFAPAKSERVPNASSASREDKSPVRNTSAAPAPKAKVEKDTSFDDLDDLNFDDDEPF